MTSRKDWWQGRREELLDLARGKTPLCVYNEETFNETLFDLLSVEAIECLLYPFHANTHPKVLEKVYEMDVGFKCVSMNELARLLKLFSRMKPGKLLFVPDFDIFEAYEYAFRLGIHVVAGNLLFYKACHDIFENREIFIQLYITHDQGTSARGIPFSEMDKISGLLRGLGTVVSGFYLHSKVRHGPSFDLNRTGSVLHGLSERFPEASTLILGDGMGICLAPDRAVLDMPETGNRLEAVKEMFPRYKLWLDPGRYIISHAGVILTRVTNHFPREDHNAITVDLDLKSFVRHEGDEFRLGIVNLSKLDHEPSSLPHRIVRNSEKPNGLCQIKCLAPVEEGDILLMPNAGAIGLETVLNSFQDHSDRQYYLKARRMCPVKI